MSQTRHWAVVRTLNVLLTCTSCGRWQTSKSNLDVTFNMGGERQEEERKYITVGILIEQEYGSQTRRHHRKIIVTAVIIIVASVGGTLRKRDKGPMESPSSSPAAPTQVDDSKPKMKDIWIANICSLKTVNIEHWDVPAISDFTGLFAINQHPKAFNLGYIFCHRHVLALL